MVYAYDARIEGILDEWDQYIEKYIVIADEFDLQSKPDIDPDAAQADFVDLFQRARQMKVYSNVDISVKIRVSTKLCPRLDKAVGQMEQWQVCMCCQHEQWRQCRQLKYDHRVPFVYLK